MPFSRRSFLRVSAAATLASLQARFSWSTTDPSTAALCCQLAADPLRPQYHLLPAHNWMNDPNGPILISRAISHVSSIQSTSRGLGKHELGPNNQS